MSADTLRKKALGVKERVVLSTAVLPDKNDVLHLRIKSRPAIWQVPPCGRKRLPK